MPSFIDRFITRQNAKGNTGPLFDQLAALATAQAQGSTPAPEPAAPVPAYDFAPALAHARAQAQRDAEAHDTAPHVVRLSLSPAAAVQTLTACLDDAPCRDSARRIFRALFELGLEVARADGHASTVTRAVYHLPAELLMAYLGLRKSAFYDNLRYLRTAGLVACDAHMGDLRGQKVATGTLWAVSLAPGRVLSGQAAPVRLLGEDWGHNWRDLNADVKRKRTVYNVLHPLKKDAPESQEMPSGVEITLETLKAWAIKQGNEEESDTLTLRPEPSAALGVVWELSAASKKRKHLRAEIVDSQARALACAFGDSTEKSLGFWRKLVWNITRGIDAGRDLSDDVGAILSRVLGDVRHDMTAGGKPPRKPGAVANAALERAGLLDQLKEWEQNVVGSRPAAA